MSVAFTREESAETAAEVALPGRPISPHPNLVTASGLKVLADAMAEYRAAYDAAHQIEDSNERRRAVALASREMRYFADRLRTAQVIPSPIEFDAVAFGHRVTFERTTVAARRLESLGKTKQTLETDPFPMSLPSLGP